MANAVAVPKLLILVGFIMVSPIWPDSVLAREIAEETIQLGARPFYLTDAMQPGALKSKLESCRTGPFKRTSFSIAHRGAPLQFPEHSRESYLAAARMGAGRIECDVTFTRDKELVCRHDQCDLHRTTDILLHPEVASKCTRPFTPSSEAKAADAYCCTSDITLKEFRSLCAKNDSANLSAQTPLAYLSNTAPFRTELYSSCATVMSHRDSIELFKESDIEFIPELKAPRVAMPMDGFSHKDFSSKMIGDYRALGISDSRIWPQSFNQQDIRFWIQQIPALADQAVYLDNRTYRQPGFRPTPEGFSALYDEGFRILAPPMWVLLALDENNDIVPSTYAVHAREAGFTLITWSLEHSGRLKEDMKEGTAGPSYYRSILAAITDDADVYRIVDVLAQQVGVAGLFSDWPATVTYYANCMDL